MIFLSGWRLEEDELRYFSLGHAYHYFENYNIISDIMAKTGIKKMMRQKYGSFIEQLVTDFSDREIALVNFL